MPILDRTPLNSSDKRNLLAKTIICQAHGDISFLSREFNLSRKAIYHTRDQVNSLLAVHDLMQLVMVKEASNIILIGSNGVGKSTIAQNIAYQTVMQGHTALFTTAANMLNDLAAQDGDNALRRRLHHYAKPRLLIIDEVGYLSYSNRHADLLFEIINRRYEKCSTLVTTNRPFSEWNEVFPNAACVVSLIDRLVHHSEIIAIEGKSYRMKEAQEQAAKRRKSNKGKSK